ncbi:hypothetical protein HK104_007914, partial [Borealophlyctis nickersoniae]
AVGGGPGAGGADAEAGVCVARAAETDADAAAWCGGEFVAFFFDGGFGFFGAVVEAEEETADEGEDDKAAEADYDVEGG